MKRILMMVLAASLVAGPALAAVPGPDDPKAQPTVRGAMAAAAEAVVEGDVAGLNATPALAQGGDKNSGKIVTGVVLILGGAALIANGADLWDSEGDVFGRKKNDDSYLLYGLGGIGAVLGTLLIRSGLRGEAW